MYIVPNARTRKTAFESQYRDMETEEYDIPKNALSKISWSVTARIIVTEVNYQFIYAVLVGFKCNHTISNCSHLLSRGCGMG